MGAGADGEVYKGVLRRPDSQEKQVAIKIPRWSRSFLREAWIMQDVRAAGGVPMLEGLTQEEPKALVMELGRGHHLAPVPASVRPSGKD